MTRWMLLLCALALPALVGGLAMAADEPKETKKAESAKPAEPAKADAAKPGLDPDLMLMVKECKFTEEQQAKLLRTVATAKAEVDAWQKTNAEKVDALQKRMDAARTAGSVDEVQKVQADAKPLMQEKMNLVMKARTAILGIMTPEQREVWQGFLLSQEILSQLQSVNLTDEQKGKVRTKSNAAAKEMIAIKGEGQEALQQHNAIGTKLVVDIKDNVLTAEQRDTLSKPAALPAGHPTVPGAGAPGGAPGGLPPGHPTVPGAGAPGGLPPGHPTIPAPAPEKSGAKPEASK